MMLINRSEMFLRKTDQSQIDFVLYKVLLTTPPPPPPPLAKCHIQIPVKQQIEHDNVVYRHGMATGPTPWGPYKAIFWLHKNCDVTNIDEILFLETAQICQLIWHITHTNGPSI